MRRLLLAAIVVVVAVIGVPRPATAHPAPWSYADVVIRGAMIDVQLTEHVLDLAHDLGVDCLFVTAGIHAEELGARNNPDTSVLSDIFAAAGVVPKAVMRQLNW